MRRIIVYGLALVILAGVPGQAGQEGAPTRLTEYRVTGTQDARQEGPCPIRWRAAYYQHGDTSPVRRIIRCAVDRWPVPGGVDKALAVASCESELRPDADNPYSTAAGVWQFLAETWRSTLAAHPAVVHKMRSISVYNARINALLGVLKAHVLGGWGPWEMGSCA